MNISCLPVSLFADICGGKMDVIDWAKEAKKQGYDGIDISVMFIKNKTSTYLKSLKTAFEEIAIPLVMMTTYPDFTHPDEMQREREYLYLLSDIALCSELNIKFLRILAGQNHPGIDVDQSIKNVVSYFEKLEPYAKQHNVELIVEDHGKPGAWDNVDFTYNPDVFLKLCKALEGTNIGINFDTGNIVAYGDDPMRIIKELDFDKIRTIHVTDMEEKGRFSPTVIGSGVTDNAAIFKYIKDRGFSGWLCIEEASGKGLEGVKKALDYVRTTYENV